MSKTLYIHITEGTAVSASYNKPGKALSSYKKFVMYFLLFAIFIYLEYYEIEMQEGTCIADDDRRPLVSMIILICIVPFYVLKQYTADNMILVHDKKDVHQLLAIVRSFVHKR